MAELEDVSLDGKPLNVLRVTDLKAALEQRGLAKSGHKSALIKRLKGALMLENLQKSNQQSGLQPNSAIGEEMSSNSFIKQYLEKQKQLLKQRLAKEAQATVESEELSADSEDDVLHHELPVSQPSDLLPIPEKADHRKTAEQLSKDVSKLGKHLQSVDADEQNQEKKEVKGKCKKLKNKKEKVERPLRRSGRVCTRQSSRLSSSEHQNVQAGDGVDVEPLMSTPSVHSSKKIEEMEVDGGDRLRARDENTRLVALTAENASTSL